MADADVINATKRSVGLSLAGPAGGVCMRTKCQDIVPKQLAKACRYALNSDSHYQVVQKRIGNMI